MTERQEWILHALRKSGTWMSMCAICRATGLCWRVVTANLAVLRHKHLVARRKDYGVTEWIFGG